MIKRMLQTAWPIILCAALAGLFRLVGTFTAVPTASAAPRRSSQQPAQQQLVLAGELAALGVQPALQGQGFGSLLLQAVEATCKAAGTFLPGMGCCALSSNHSKDSASAKAFNMESSGCSLNWRTDTGVDRISLSPVSILVLVALGSLRNISILPRSWLVSAKLCRPDHDRAACRLQLDACQAARSCLDRISCTTSCNAGSRCARCTASSPSATSASWRIGAAVRAKHAQQQHSRCGHCRPESSELCVTWDPST